MWGAPFFKMNHTGLKTSQTGRIHSIETFGSVDGPGIRFIIFLQGCHMRCAYCHNPDTWSTDGGSDMTVGELLDKAERYRAYWGEDGGITVSGGEALLQTDFLLSLFREAKRRGISTCIDTSAQPFTRQEPFFSQFEELMKVTDTILLDIKHIDTERHKALTGWKNENILDCAAYLSSIRKPVWIRHVLVPGHTDSDAQLTALNTFLQKLHNIQKIEVLPYHTLGIYKWEKLQMDYRLKDVPTPSEDAVRHAQEILTRDIRFLALT